MVPVSLSPIFNDPQYFDNNGHLLAGGKIYQYQGGSFTAEQSTYTTADGDVANANPIILDSSGRANTAIWLMDGYYYNLVLTDHLDTIIESYDNVYGVPQPVTGGGIPQATIWVTAGQPPTYVNATQFLLPGDWVTSFATGNRVRWQNTDLSYNTGTVTASTYTSPNTTVTIQPDGALLNSGIVAVASSALTAQNMTVDAGAVSYSSALTYTGTNTVGSRISTLSAQQTIIMNNILGLSTAWQTTGSGANTPYAVSVITPVTTYGTASGFRVEFMSPSSGSPTLNVNGIGAVPLVQYTGTGSLVPAICTAGLISDVAYNGADFVLMNPLPTTIVSRSFTTTYYGTTFAVNGTYSPPSNTVGIYVYSQDSGGSNRGAEFGVEVYNGLTLLGTVIVGGANIFNGTDGGSGMMDSNGSYVPLAMACTSVKFVQTKGANPLTTIQLQAVVQYA